MNRNETLTQHTTPSLLWLSKAEKRSQAFSSEGSRDVWNSMLNALKKCNRSVEFWHANSAHAGTCDATGYISSTTKEIQYSIGIIRGRGFMPSNSVAGYGMHCTWHSLWSTKNMCSNPAICMVNTRILPTTMQDAKIMNLRRDRPVPMELFSSWSSECQRDATASSPKIKRFSKLRPKSIASPESIGGAITSATAIDGVVPNCSVDERVRKYFSFDNDRSNLVSN